MLTCDKPTATDEITKLLCPCGTDWSTVLGQRLEMIAEASSDWASYFGSSTGEDLIQQYIDNCYSSLYRSIVCERYERLCIAARRAADAVRSGEFTIGQIEHLACGLVDEQDDLLQAGVHVLDLLTDKDAATFSDIVHDMLADGDETW